MVRYFLVNSNRSHLRHMEKLMLRGNYVNALYGPKEKIDVIQKGDIVFLYANRVGIIAYGVADGRLLIRDYRGDEGVEHRMHVDRFRILSIPIMAPDINQMARRHANAGIFYARTVSRLKAKVGAAVFDLCEISKKKSPTKNR